MKNFFISLLILAVISFSFFVSGNIYAQDVTNTNPNNNGINDNNINNDGNRNNNIVDNNQNNNVPNNNNNGNLNNNGLENNGANDINDDMEDDDVVDNDNLMEKVTYGLGGVLLGSAVTFLLLRNRRTM